MRVLLPLLLFWCSAAPLWADPAALAQINTLRSDRQRAALVYDMTLERVARAHAQDMSQQGYFSHTGANGSTIGQRISAQGYKWCFAAENIAKGQKSLNQVMGDWARSKGHYRNMIHKQARSVGLARTKGNIWVMVLARPC